jgi:hypothetical protein
MYGGRNCPSQNVSQNVAGSNSRSILAQNALALDRPHPPHHHTIYKNLQFICALCSKSAISSVRVQRQLEDILSFKGFCFCLVDIMQLNKQISKVSFIVLSFLLVPKKPLKYNILLLT